MSETAETEVNPAQIKKDVRSRDYRRKMLRNVALLTSSELGQESVAALIDYCDELEAELHNAAQALADL